MTLHVLENITVLTTAVLDSLSSTGGVASAQIRSKLSPAMSIGALLDCIRLKKPDLRQIRAVA